MIGTGSEVHLVLATREKLLPHGIRARVVSMPSWELFDEQPVEYRDQVLPPGVPKMSVEAGITTGWRDYVGDCGDVVGINRFGASAPGDVVYEKLGFHVSHLMERGPGPAGKVRHSCGREVGKWRAGGAAAPCRD